MNRHVFIAVPAHSGDIRHEHLRSLLLTLPLLSQNGIAYTHSLCIGNALVHDARNALVAWFMSAPECTDLLFIDADIAWDPKDALKLAMSPHDVIGGLYRQKREPECYNVAGLRPTPTRLVECDYLGTGFLKISRKAIEKLQGLHPDLRYPDPHGYDRYGLFQAPIENGKLTGEDAFFCRLWKEAGGKVFFDPDMTLRHIGTTEYVGNFGQWAERMGKERVA